MKCLEIEKSVQGVFQTGFVITVSRPFLSLVSVLTIFISYTADAKRGALVAVNT